jgi:uncharacterized alkaline shock family protein YloU
VLIYALIGRSGSGKSHRAQQISREYGIEYIIDDGLLINGTRVVAGASAKREDTSIAAVKRAIFANPYHRDEVARALVEMSPPSLLILGTSDNMIDRITQNLSLPDVFKKIYIEDISTPREIEMATRTRREQGKHVIPVPTFAIKKDFSGYFIDSMKNLTRRGKSSETDADDIEKTVVRPTYSYLGRYTIANNVIKSMAAFAAEGVEGVHKVTRVSVDNKQSGINIVMDVSVNYGQTIPDVAKKLQVHVRNEKEHMTAFNILEISVYVKGINTEK